MGWGGRGRRRGGQAWVKIDSGSVDAAAAGAAVRQRRRAGAKGQRPRGHWRGRLAAARHDLGRQRGGQGGSARSGQQ